MPMPSCQTPATNLTPKDKPMTNQPTVNPLNFATFRGQCDSIFRLEFLRIFDWPHATEEQTRESLEHWGFSKDTVERVIKIAHAYANLGDRSDKLCIARSALGYSAYEPAYIGDDSLVVNHLKHEAISVNCIAMLHALYPDKPINDLEVLQDVKNKWDIVANPVEYQLSQLLNALLKSGMDTYLAKLYVGLVRLQVSDSVRIQSVGILQKNRYKFFVEAVNAFKQNVRLLLNVTTRCEGDVGMSDAEVEACYAATVEQLKSKLSASEINNFTIHNFACKPTQQQVEEIKSLFTKKTLTAEQFCTAVHILSMQ